MLDNNVNSVQYAMRTRGCLESRKAINSTDRTGFFGLRDIIIVPAID